MAISNVNTANQPASVNRTSSSATTHASRKERLRDNQDDRNDSTVVTLSADAQNLQRSESAQTSSQEHAERIRAINRSDQMAQEKMAVDAREEARVLAAKRKDDEQFYKRINTFA